MPLSRVGSSVLALALGAAADAAEPLNSERIEAEFGSYGIDVISYEDGLRRASLYSQQDGCKITRTYAIVHFDHVPPDLRTNEHARILAGGSIGATFKAAGWVVTKQTLYIGSLDLRDDVHGLFARMQLRERPELAMHVYRLNVKKGMQSVDYATIVELHHPAYMTEERLLSIFGAGTTARVDDARLKHWRSLALQDSHAAHDAD